MSKPTKDEMMFKLRCPQCVWNEDGARDNGQYSFNAPGTAKFRSPADED